MRSTRNRFAAVAACLIVLIAAVNVSASPAPEGVREVNITHTPYYRSGEPEIAVNPRNQKNLVYVATYHKQHETPVPGVDVPPFPYQFGGEEVLGNGDLQCVVSYSFDNGDTWQNSLLPVAPLYGCSDPMVAAAPDGTFYAAFDWLGSPYLDNIPGQNLQVGVVRSTDGGRNWSDPVSTGTEVDRPMFRVDPSTGWLYEESGLATRLLSISKDRGATWTVVKPPVAEVFPAVAVQQPGYSGFPGTHLAVNHNVVATAVAATAAAGPMPANDMQLATLDATLSSDNPGYGVWTMKPVPNSAGGSGDWVSADPAVPGRFAVMQAKGDDLQIFTTDDAGNTWSAPASIPAPGANKEWFDYGPNHRMAVMWKATNTAGLIDVWSVISTDGGHTWSRPLRVNSKSFPPESAQNGPGDDLSWALLGDRYAYFGWGDTRDHADSDSTDHPMVNGYFARVPLTAYR